MKIGMVGLGRMGGNMAERLRQGGHEVVGYTRSAKVSQVASLAELVATLAPPRTVWLMIPAGPPIEATLTELFGEMEAGDVIVEGGNSNFHDSIRRHQEASERNIGFIDAGVSGGVWGLTEGYSIMVGGESEDVERLRPIFETLAPKDGFAHVGPPGAGHFTKMVHNGIEYGLMQSYAEGYELLNASELGIDIKGAIDVWRHGSVVRSWLLDLLAKALEEDPGLTNIRGYAEDSGEGRWTVEEAIAHGVPAPVISAALFARFASRQEDAPAMKVIAALRNQFGGHAVRSQE